MGAGVCLHLLIDTPMIKYIIEFVFCSAAFMALYKLLIDSRIAHAWARRYLVVTMFLSLVIPALELPLYPAHTIYYEIPLIAAHNGAADGSLTMVAESEISALATAATEVVAFDAPSRSSVDWSAVLLWGVWVIYLLITMLNLARFAWRIYIIGRLRRHSTLTVYELYTLAVNDSVREPFSFWRTIFTNRSFSEVEHRQIILHELSHIRHHHTAERLALELLRCVAWFNPMVWLAGSALVEVQEWEADGDVLSEGYDVYEYRQLIFRQLFGYHPDIANGLSSQTSKKRFLMMTNFKKGQHPFLRLGATLSVVVALVFAFGSVRAKSEMVIKKPTPAVVLAEVAENPSVAEVPSPAKSSAEIIEYDDANTTPEPENPAPEVTFTKASPMPTSEEDSPFVKTTDIISLTVDDECVQIKIGESEQTIFFELSKLNSGNILSILQQFITKDASSQMLQHQWAGGKKWSYPQSNAVIVVDARNDATVADVRRVRDWARYAVAQLRNELSLEQINVQYFYLCEHDCNLIERAVPTQVILTPDAQNILDLSPETDVIYSYADQQPRFMGKQGLKAQQAFDEWMRSQDAYKELLKELPKSVCKVRLVVEKDGSLHAVSHLDRELDGRPRRMYLSDVSGVTMDWMPDIMENICAASPRWKPAKHNGKPVRMEFTMYMQRRKILLRGWNSDTHAHVKSAPRGVVVNPKQTTLGDIKITKITFTDHQTVVDFNLWGPPSYWARIQSNAVLTTGHRTYPILDAIGTDINVKYWIPKSGTGMFQLIFPPIECKVDKLAFHESSWSIEDIDLSELTSQTQGGENIPAGYK